MPRIYYLPDFHLTCNIWAGVPFTATSPLGPPRARNVPCQFVYRPYTETPVLKVPAGTDIRNGGVLIPGENPTDVRLGGDIVECPAGSGRYFQVFQVDNVALGYPNEYRAALVVPATPYSTEPDPSYQGRFPTTRP